MTYEIVVPNAVQKQFRRLPNSVKERLSRALLDLEENPFPTGVSKLSGGENEYRVRVGDYRIAYRIIAEEVVILLLSVGHRKDIYRN